MTNAEPQEKTRGADKRGRWKPRGPFRELSENAALLLDGFRFLRILWKECKTESDDPPSE